MEKDEVYYAEESPQMIDAYKKARDTFKYFWRELWWEQRRIVPALEMACVKVKFEQKRPDTTPMVEHMWIDDIDFDGIHLKGFLLNSPDYLTNYKEGDLVEIPVTEISDWLFAINGKAYGGFTIQVMRGEMDKRERKEHDKAWGLDFGDPDYIQVAYEQDKNPENLVEHPMCKNVRESLMQFLSQHPGELSAKDESGYTMLHREAVAGNKACVEVLLEMGADRNARTNSGHTASDLAEIMQWEHLSPVL